MENAEVHTHKIETEEKFGEVRIADEVVDIIAGLAASEVEGVASMAGNVTRDLIEKLGMKSLSKGVKITMDEDTVRVALAINIRYGRRQWAKLPAGHAGDGREYLSGEKGR